MSCRTYKNACNQPMVTSRDHTIYFVNKRRHNQNDAITIITIDVGGGSGLSGSAVIASVGVYNEIGSGGMQFGGVAIEEYELAQFFGGSAPGGTTSLAIDDNYFTIQDTPLDSTNFQSVHANDTNQGSEDLVAYLNTPPSNSQEFYLYRNGHFYYDPAPGFFGTDTFRYQNFDGTGWTNEAEVTIDVFPT